MRDRLPLPFGSGEERNDRGGIPPFQARRMAMKKLFAVIGLVLVVSMLALAAGSAGKAGTWSGWISDAKCGAKVDAACAKKCVDAGEKAVFVNDKDKAVYPIANQDAVKAHAGHHVEVKGTMDNNTLTVSNITMMKDQTMK
jgi:hypothetical protein